jgi:hypothetical protein
MMPLVLRHCSPRCQSQPEKYDRDSLHDVSSLQDIRGSRRPRMSRARGKPDLRGETRVGGRRDFGREPGRRKRSEDRSPRDSTRVLARRDKEQRPKPGNRAPALPSEARPERHECDRSSRRDPAQRDSETDCRTGFRPIGDRKARNWRPPFAPQRERHPRCMRSGSSRATAELRSGQARPPRRSSVGNASASSYLARHRKTCR